MASRRAGSDSANYRQFTRRRGPRYPAIRPLPRSYRPHIFVDIALHCHYIRRQLLGDADRLFRRASYTATTRERRSMEDPCQSCP